MATLQLAIKDPLYAAVLASYDGVDDAERLAAWKKDIRVMARERVMTKRRQAVAEENNARMRAIDAGAADLDA